MNSHDGDAALLDAFIDGELSGRDADAVRERLSVSGADRDYVTDALAMRDWFPDEEETVVPEGFAESVLAALPVRRRTASVWRSPWVRMALPVAACVAVLLLVQGVRKDAVTNGPTGFDTDGTYVEAVTESECDEVADAETPQEEMSVYGAEASDDADAETDDVNVNAASAYEERMSADAVTPEPSAPRASGSASSALKSAPTAEEAAPETDMGVILAEDADAATVALCTATADAAALMEPYVSAASTESGMWYLLKKSEFAELYGQLTERGCLTSLERVAADGLPDGVPSLMSPYAVYVLLQTS